MIQLERRRCGVTWHVCEGWRSRLDGLCSLRGIVTTEHCVLYKTCNPSILAQSAIALDIPADNECKPVDTCKTKVMRHDTCYCLSGPMTSRLS